MLDSVNFYAFIFVGNIYHRWPVLSINSEYDGNLHENESAHHGISTINFTRMPATPKERCNLSVSTVYNI